MFHSSFPKRLVSIQYLLLNKPFYPSIFQRSISALHQSPHIQIQASYFSNTHNEILGSFDHILRRCINIQQAKQINAHIVLWGVSHSAFLAARLISVYAKFGLLNDARKVFETTLVHFNCNLLLWNSILRANVSSGEYKESLDLYLRMRNLCVCADGFTFPLLLRACAMIGDFNLGRNIHCQVVREGYRVHLHVVNELLGMYAKFGRMDIARRLFDRMNVKNHISWNTMVSGFSCNYNCYGALETFRQMEFEGWVPNPVTWTSLLSSFSRCGQFEKTLEFYILMRNKGIDSTAEALAVVLSVCADLKDFVKGKIVHGYVMRSGFDSYLLVNNSLICMYGKNGALKEANFIFSKMNVKNIVTWNALITSFAESGLCDDAFAIFSQLDTLDDYPVVRANVISWSAVISGFASKGQGEQALDLFRKMQLAKVTANAVTICTALSVCAELSALALGREIHAHLIKNLMQDNILVGNGLINMYAKCGNLREGHLVFEKIDGKDLFSWNTMIAGYGMHGFGECALQTFYHMIEAGHHPDGVTFVAVLSACGHAGLVPEGRILFDRMRCEFNIEPQMEHYACMVDLLGRAGLLQEATSIVKHMPIEPNTYVWGALLNSCRMYKNKDLVEETASQIFSLNSNMMGSYMLLSNIYAADGKWEESARVRMYARANGIKKIAGQSWIQVKKKVYMFSAGNAMQKGMEGVFRILNHMILQMEMEGVLLSKNYHLQYFEEEEYACLGQEDYARVIKDWFS